MIGEAINSEIFHSVDEGLVGSIKSLTTLKVEIEENIKKGATHLVFECNSDLRMNYFKEYTPRELLEADIKHLTDKLEEAKKKLEQLVEW